jgi:hypothetical protein
MTSAQPLNLSDAAHAQGYYLDPTDSSSPQYRGVTSLLKAGMPPYLVPWAAKTAAEWAVAHRAEWADLDDAAAVDVIKRAPNRLRDAAADRGTIVHRILELSEDDGAPSPDLWDGSAAPYIEAGLRFIADFRPRWIWREATVFNPEAGYAGTLDFIAEIAGLGEVVGDWKTSRAIYPEVAAQLAAYRFAHHAVDVMDRRLQIPHIDGAIAVHLRADGTYAVHPVKADEAAYEAVMACVRVVEWKRRRGIVGEAIAPPAPKPGTAPVVAGQSRYEWIRERIKAITTADVDAEKLRRYDVASAGALLVMWWPEDVPTPITDALTSAQIASLAQICDAVESALRLAFPPSRDPDQIAKTDPISPSHAAGLRERSLALPNDLVVDIPLSSHISTALARDLQEQLDIAERVHEERLRRLADLLATACVATGQSEDATKAAITDIVADGRRVEWRKLTAEQIRKATALVDAVSYGFLAGDFRPNDQTASLIVTTHRSKSAATAHVRPIAKELGLTAPRSFADLIASPLLVALSTIVDEGAEQ